MDKVILSPIPLDELENKLRDIVKQELQIHIPHDSEEKLLSLEETRKIFDPPISRMTLINWTKAGKLTAYRNGGRRIYYKRSEVIAASTTLQKYGRK